ncbi:MAG: acetylglutamate kinase [Candidatus Margulisiibacteriota bacterium]|jgi:acetylglutamate kinase
MYKQRIEKAKILLEALPYIKKFHQKQIIIKYGGSVMVDDNLKNSFAEDVVLLKYVGLHPIIVHGGGKEITKWINKVGKEAVFIDGLRFTDSETMEITEMVLSGKINSEIVSLINSFGGKAVGLSGKDAQLFTAKKTKSTSNQDLGLVGVVEKTDISILNILCEKGYIPVISSIGINKKGESLNLNADHVAAEIAKALNVLKLIYLTDVQGILLNNNLVPTLNLEEANKLVTNPEIKGGMIPKLKCSIDAIENNVENVHIINGSIEHAVLLEIFTNVGIGTMISKRT